MPSAFCSLVPNTFEEFQTSIRGLHHADGFTIPATPDGVGTAGKRRKQPMLTLIVGRSMVESEFSKTASCMSVVSSHREHFWHFVVITIRYRA